MTGRDILRFSFDALGGYRLRTSLMLLAMAIGVAAVVILTALGEGARRYVSNEFTSLGTHLLIVLPGRSETAGGGLNVLVGSTVRDLTLDDALAITRHSAVRRIAPLVVGSATVSIGHREREIAVLGSSAALQPLRQWTLQNGRFLPDGELDQARPVAVLGGKAARELFPSASPIGQWLRIGDRRFHVIGVLAAEGRSMGMDAEDVVIIPVAAAQALFNSNTLFRIMVEVNTREQMPAVDQFILKTISERHQGERDITVITQDAVLATFDRIFTALTLTLAGIAAISLAVAGVLIMNVMLISVTHRTAEIGLLKAIGASSRQVMILFITEATLLSAFGATLGLITGWLGSALIRALYPQLPASAPWWAIIASVLIALASGIIFGLMPARRAARLDPVLALSRR
ncbi:MAG: ABC transporter permease [Gammaproteobacteria bacterium]|nr:ABC transporter permease [Gammaproteobacteria bacterium]